ncbi:MAG: hypothetical protein P8J37_05320, partial [Fuerstiella sp.]|nr:hypothetical protein [Fuerstiella sp.]
MLWLDIGLVQQLPDGPRLRDTAPTTCFSRAQRSGDVVRLNNRAFVVASRDRLMCHWLCQRLLLLKGCSAINQ